MWWGEKRSADLQDAAASRGDGCGWIVLKALAASIAILALALLLEEAGLHGAAVVGLVAFVGLPLWIVVRPWLHPLGPAPARTRWLGTVFDRVAISSRRTLSGDRIETDWLTQKAWRAMLRHDYDGSAALYRRAAERGDAHAMNNLATVLADHLDASAEAELWYRRAIDAGDALAAENLALMRLDQDRLDEARALFELAIRRGQPSGHAGLAQIELDRGRPDRARGLLEIAAIEGDEQAYAPLGEVLLSLGREQEAEGWLREGIAKGAPGTATVLGRLLYAAGREQEADALKWRIEREARDLTPPG